MSWLLDTDVLCQPAKAKGDPSVIAWLEEHENECYTCTIVIAKIAYWIRTKNGRQRARLQTWFDASIEALEGRILSFNTAAAHVWADQQIALEENGQLMPVEDSYIAAIAQRHNLTVVTGNQRDFTRPGISVFNPFAT